jgi:hypothetical protein
MNFDLKETAEAMQAAFKGAVGEHWKDASGLVGQMLKGYERRMLLLAKAVEAGEITLDEVPAHLDDQRLIWEAQMEAIKTLSKAIAQKAVNAALDVLYTALKNIR